MEVICSNPLCGRLFVYHGGSAHFARSATHCCSRVCQNTTHGQDGTKRFGLWENAKRRAQKRGTSFSLKLSDVPEIPLVCPVLGIEIVANTKAGPLDSSPSLDRIKPSAGYAKGNVRIISYRANRLRSDASARELMLVAVDAQKLEDTHE